MKTFKRLLLLLLVATLPAAGIQAQQKSARAKKNAANSTNVEQLLNTTRSNSPIAEGKARIVLMAGDLWPNAPAGYQMLIGKDQWGNKIPTTGPLPGFCNISSEYYNAFAYKIPANADAKCNAQNVVLNGSATIDIEAGEWDYCITNPTANDRIWIPGAKPGQTNNGRRQKFNFKAGYEYQFAVDTYEYVEAGDTVISDYVTITEKPDVNQWVYNMTGKTLTLGSIVLNAMLINGDIQIGQNQGFSTLNNALDLSIPVCGGYPITELFGGAFSESTLTTITLPPSLEMIGDVAFEGCSRLTAITIPAATKEIGANAFKGCTSIASFSVDAANQYFKAVDKVLYTFDGTILMAYPNAKNGNAPHAFTIPNGVGTIGLSAFYGCNNLSSVTIPGSVTTIGGWAFEGCVALSSITYEGDKEPTVYTDAFKSGPSLRTLNIPNASSGFGTNANNKWGASNIVYGAGGGYSFDSQTGVLTVSGNVTTIRVEDVNTAIGRQKWEDVNTTLKSVVIASTTVATIEDYAFANCNGLTQFHLPASVSSVKGQAFIKCTSLTTITVAAGNTHFKSVDGVLFNHAGTKLVAFPYKNTKNYTLPDEVTIIGQYAFYSCMYTNVVFNETLTTVESYAFYGNAETVWICLPATLKEIQSMAFYNCWHMSDITYLGLTEPTIATDAFYCKNLLRNLYLPNATHGFTPSKWGGVLTIKYREYPPLGYLYEIATGTLTVFEYITIKGSRNTIKASEINRVLSRADSEIKNSALKRVLFATPSVATIESNAFANCPGLTEFHIPKSVTNIGYEAFIGCSGLKSFTVEDGSQFKAIDGVLCYLPQSSNRHILIAYPNAKGVDYTVPESVSIIEWGAFCGSSIQSITLPASVNTIRNRAFLLCNQLTSVTYLGITQPGNLQVDAFSPLASRVLYLPNVTGGFDSYKSWWGATGIVYKIDDSEVKKRTKGQAEVEIPLGNPTDDYTIDLYDTPEKDGPPVKRYNYSAADPQSKHRIVEGKVQFDLDELGATAYYANITVVGALRAERTYSVVIPAYAPAISYSITFDSNGGSSVSSDEAGLNSLIVRPTNPTRLGYLFKGWFKEAACINAWNFDADKLTANTVLYAKWELVTNIEEANGAKVIVYGKKGSIEISGLTEGSNYTVHTINGATAASDIANGQHLTIPLPRGIYVVSASGQKTKVVVE